MKKQVISAVIVAMLLILAAGTVETMPIITLACLAIMGGTVYLGGLTKEKP